MSDERQGHAKVIQGTLVFCRQSLDWLIGHHAGFAAKTSHYLAADERATAIWKLSGESIAHAVALVDLLERGYTGQTWSVMRAIHEADRLRVAVTDPEEERIVRRWLGDQEVQQAEARDAEQRQADRLATEMRQAGIDPAVEHVKQFSKKIYKGMSRAAHHRRSTVDELSTTTHARSSTARTHVRNSASHLRSTQQLSSTRSCYSSGMPSASCGARPSIRITSLPCCSASMR